VIPATRQATRGNRVSPFGNLAMRTGRSMIASTAMSAASSGVSIRTGSHIFAGAIIVVATGGTLIVVNAMPSCEDATCAQREKRRLSHRRTHIRTFGTHGYARPPC
jgi:hypothetical protein